jgi:hypothetical protein
MTKCKYVLGDFQCEEEPIDSGYCIFHDENYYRLHPEEIDEAFKKKLLGKTDPLICTGYNLVNVRFEGDITKSLDWKCPACNWTEYVKCWKCGTSIDTESPDGYSQVQVRGVWVYECDRCGDSS